MRNFIAGPISIILCLIFKFAEVIETAAFVAGKAFERARGVWSNSLASFGMYS